MPFQFADTQGEVIDRLLRQAGLSGSDRQLERLAGDGSDRSFVRLRFDSGATVLAVLPPGTDSRSLAEARAAFHVGRHLRATGTPVPEIFGFDADSGIFLCADLGDRLLHRFQQEEKAEAVVLMYHRTIEVLVHLQVAGKEGFRPEYCWDTPQYDRSLMLERESGYFLRAFCRNLLGLAAAQPELDLEFQHLADLASRPEARYLMHRDFQSRNLMVHGGTIRVIDFQGARFGPLGYDLASLLIDPYADLAPALQQELLEYYISELANRVSFDDRQFLIDYYYLALQRNLQILGAFAFLWQEKGKHFFLRFLQPAAVALLNRLENDLGTPFPVLRLLVAESLTVLKQLNLNRVDEPRR